MKPDTSKTIRVVLAAALVGLAACGSGTGATDSTAGADWIVYGTPVVTGGALPVYGTTIDAAVGMQIPSIEGQNFLEEPVSIAPDGRGKVLVFLAHWCPHCQDELPVVVDWMNTNPVPDGVDIIAVVTATRAGQPNYPPTDWLAREDWDGIVVVDDVTSTVANAFGLNAFPFFVSVSADGVVESRSAGASTAEAFGASVAAVAP